jgi:hypothetical protein
MSKKTLMFLGAAAALYFLVLKKKPVRMVPSPGPGMPLPTDSMAAATMPGAVQGMITDGARQAQSQAMQGFYY